MQQDKDNHARQQAQAHYDSIKALVAALNCDFDRLEELKEERQQLADLCQFPESDRDTLGDERRALEAWDGENGEELADLLEQAGEYSDRDAVEQAIQEYPLSIEVRSDWHTPGSELDASTEFRILLCTGGPAVQIRGELGEYGSPTRAWLQCQDWFTGWQDYYPPNDPMTGEESAEVLLAFAQCFYFGE